jgi:hypothetical protein
MLDALYWTAIKYGVRSSMYTDQITGLLEECWWNSKLDRDVDVDRSGSHCLVGTHICKGPEGHGRGEIALTNDMHTKYGHLLESSVALFAFKLTPRSQVLLVLRLCARLLSPG